MQFKHSKYRLNIYQLIQIFGVLKKIKYRIRYGAFVRYAVKQGEALAW